MVTMVDTSRTAGVHDDLHRLKANFHMALKQLASIAEMNAFTLPNILVLPDDSSVVDVLVSITVERLSSVFQYLVDEYVYNKELELKFCQLKLELSQQRKEVQQLKQDREYVEAKLDHIFESATSLQMCRHKYKRLSWNAPEGTESSTLATSVVQQTSKGMDALYPVSEQTTSPLRSDHCRTVRGRTGKADNSEDFGQDVGLDMEATAEDATESFNDGAKISNRSVTVMSGSSLEETFTVVKNETTDEDNDDYVDNSDAISSGIAVGNDSGQSCDTDGDEEAKDHVPDEELMPVIKEEFVEAGPSAEIAVSGSVEDGGKVIERVKSEEVIQQRASNSATASHICDVCGKAYRTKSGFSKHQLRAHGNTTLAHIKCKICSMRFTTKGHFEGHVNSHHNSNKPYACGHCSSRYAYRSTLLRHVSSCHPKIASKTKARVPGPKQLWNCDVCWQTFARSDGLRAHKKAMHLNQCSYHCDVCNMGFKWRGSLRRHKMSKAHLDKVNDEGMEQMKTEPPASPAEAQKD